MILMLNCSYKGKNGNTRYFLGLLAKELMKASETKADPESDQNLNQNPEQNSGQKCKIVSLKTVLNGKMDEFVKELQKAEALVIGAPLYVDGLPAQAVKIMEVLLDNCREAFPNLPVYVVSNLGFYESEQIRNLFDMVRNWCERMGCVYGGGLGVCAGPMISTLKKMPLKSGLNKDIGNGLVKMAAAISAGESTGNYYCKTRIPRRVYMLAAHKMFRRTLKENKV